MRNATKLGSNSFLRKLGILIVLVGLVGGGFFAWRHFAGRSSDLHLPSQTKASVSRFTIGDAAFYLQRDSRWANEKNAGSGESLKSVGCTLCCLSMALAHHGIEMPPPELNRRLAEASGYTEDGWVKWST